MSISRLQTLLHYFHFEKIVFHPQSMDFLREQRNLVWHFMGNRPFHIALSDPLSVNDLNEWKAENYVLGKAQENIKLLIKLRHKNQIWCSKLLSYVFKFERINQNDRQSDYFRPFSQVYFIISACLQSKKYRNPHAFNAV